MPGKIRGKLIYPFQTSTDKVWEWTSKFVPYFIMDVITYPHGDWGFKHQSCTVQCERISHCTTRVVTSALMCISASDLTMHGTSCLNPIMSNSFWYILHYEAEICKRISTVGGDESCIVENVCIVLQVTSMALPLWRHKEDGCLANFVPIILNEIDYIWNTNSG